VKNLVASWKRAASQGLAERSPSGLLRWLIDADQSDAFVGVPHELTHLRDHSSSEQVAQKEGARGE
jgi:hypothetical protein